MGDISDLKSDYREKYGFQDPESCVFKSRKGIDPEVVREISRRKKEPGWMLDFRLRALDIFLSKPMPDWGDPELLGQLRFDDITYYLKPSERAANRWEDVPETIKNTFERLGIPEAERKFLAGVTAQYESEAVYHAVNEQLSRQGVLFTDMDTALREHPDVVAKYLGTVVPPSDNKFAALNSAVWSGGSFIFVPKGVSVAMPLQAYFRINAERSGQFERTLIVADEGSSVHYVEGCTAPIYAADSLHAAVVEVIALPGSHIRYTTIQNWSNNVYNLVTKRALARERAVVEWVDGNIGSKLTMKYPAVILAGEGARADVVSCAFAGRGQHQDTGSKLVFAAPLTSGTILSKSISKDGGRASYRGLVQVLPKARGARASVRCDALMLDEASRSDTYPVMRVDCPESETAHEASVSKIGADQLFYIMSRGLREADAVTMVVNGFFEAFSKELPLEYAVELNRLVQLEMEGSVG
jgi:Fe-S cluster assembly protein SufB